MTEQNIVEQWKHRILSREITYLPELIERAVLFLDESRNERGAWSAFRQLPTDFHCSSLVIQALFLCDHKRFDHVIQDALLPLKSYIVQNHSEMGIQDVADALNLLSSTVRGADENGDCVEKLIVRLQTLRDGFGWGRPEPSISTTAEVFLALQTCGRIPDWFAPALATVVGFQHNEDGGWPISPEGRSAALSSALMLRVLTQARGERYARNKLACLGFFKRLLATGGWETLKGSSGDVFIASVTLRSLASVSEAPYELVLQGAEFLRREANSGGAWGVGKDGASSVELTSLCVAALAAAGENRFTTSRIATEALRVAGTAVAELAKEKEQLKQDIQGHVRDEIGNVIKERDRLNEQVKRLEVENRRQASDLSSAQKQVSQLQVTVSRLEVLRGDIDFSTSSLARIPFMDSDSRDFALTFVSSSIYILAGGIFFVVVRQSLIWVHIPYFWLRSLILGLAAMVVLSSVALTAYRTTMVLLRRQRRYLTRAAYIRSTAEPDAVLVFEGMASSLAEWPPSKRQDFIFRLMRESLNVDPKEWENYSSYIGKRYGDNEAQTRRLRQLVGLFMALPMRAREEVAIRLREMSWVRPLA